MIYLDHAATTPLHPQVMEAMKPFLTHRFGNPSSLHAWGREARAGVERAREQVASSLHVKPEEVLFTSGGTESDNLAIKGIALARQEKGRHIITSSIEHHAVLHACEALERWGYEVTYLPVDERGRVSPEDLLQAIRKDTILVSIHFGNNEVGTIQRVESFGAICRERGIPFHTDAVQVLDHGPIDLSRLPIDLASFSAHKINGPKGVGALYVAHGISLFPLLHGGVQESKMRAGTENVPGIVGFGEAISISTAETLQRRERNLLYRRKLLTALRESGVSYIVNGDEENFLSHILNLSFPGVNRDSLLIQLDLNGIAASAGSACTAGSLEPSHVLNAMGVGEERLNSAIRFSFGWGLRPEEVEEAGLKIGEIVKRLQR
ncbi:cysteine desulfurase involved in tRNA thiolation [[Clostridium] ultunense Esp]|nr:cysteine desulfurase involved in tRNA thiolation [[Clostridium] ultunense Esp]